MTSTLRLLASLSVVVLIGLAPLSAQDSLLNVIAAHPKDSNGVKAMISLSVNSLKQSYDSALYWGQRAYRLAREIDFRKGEASSLMRLGNAYSFKGDYDSAEWAYTEALDIYIISGEHLGMGKIYNNLGLMYRYMADYPKSAEFFMKSLEVKKIYGNDVDIGVGYQNLGIVYAIQGNHRAAEPFLVDALESFRLAGDSLKYYEAMIDVSSLKREMGEHDRSIELLKTAYAFNKRIGNKTQMGICIYNIAFSSYDAGALTEALAYYKEAKLLFQTLGNKVRVTGCNIRIATCLLDMGQASEAERVAQEGLELLRNLSSPVQEYQMFELLARAQAAQGNYEEAYANRLKYAALKDSLDTEEQSLKITELQEKYESELNKRKIAELTSKNRQVELSSRKKQVENYILIAIAVLALLLVGMFFARARSKKRINDTLREKQAMTEHALEEKEVLLREIHHRVQNNLQFVSSLLNLQSRRVSDENTITALQECKLRIQSMALVHQKLYQEESLRGIDFYNYTQNLIDSLMSSYRLESGKVQPIINMDHILLDINTAIPMGLILNELLTNVFKYAFPEDRKGVVEVGLHESGDALLMIVRDDGVGLAEEEETTASTSFGLKLIRSLAQKLKADIEIKMEGGTEVRLRIHSYIRV